MTKNCIYTCVLILLSDQTCLFDKGSSASPTTTAADAPYV